MLIILDKQTSEKCVASRDHGQVQEAWERYHNDQASIWQVYSSIIIFVQMGKTREQYGDHLTVLLPNAPAPVYMSNAPVIGKRLRCNIKGHNWKKFFMQMNWPSEDSEFISTDLLPASHVALLT